MSHRSLVERSGGVVVWKPTGCTSRRALEETEVRLGVGPLGHTGTLDPLACGILVLLGGEARKLQAILTAHDKEYEARVALGLRSGSDDGEGPVWSVVPKPRLPSHGALIELAASFEGELEQVPPALSAIRVGGVRAHRLARGGQPVEVPSRKVRVDRLEVVDWRPPVLEIKVSCGPGTYVRSIARDLGERAGTGGFLVALRRTRVGAFTEADATAVSCVTSACWLTVEQLARGLPRIDVDDSTVRRLGQGQRVHQPGVSRSASAAREAIAWCGGRAVCLVELDGDLIRPRRGLRHE